MKARDLRYLRPRILFPGNFPPPSLLSPLLPLFLMSTPEGERPGNLAAHMDLSHGRTTGVVPKSICSLSHPRDGPCSSSSTTFSRLSRIRKDSELHSDPEYAVEELLRRLNPTISGTLPGKRISGVSVSDNSLLRYPYFDITRADIVSAV